MSSLDRREQRHRQIAYWMKWGAVIISATLLATTLLLVHKLRTEMGTSNPASAVAIDLRRPVTAR
jgi:hypothetical protein